MPRAAIALVLLALFVPGVATAAPKHASSRLRNVEDRLEVHVASGTAAVILDTLEARLRRGGYAVTGRDSVKYRLTVDRAASLDEAHLLADTYEGSERIRLRFEITAPKDDEAGHRVTAAIWYVSNLNAVGEKILDVGKRQPYLNEVRAFLRGLQADFGS